MKTSELTREQISALSDGALDEAQTAPVLAALRGDEARATWELYHEIGDVLRSEDMAVGMSRDFSARFAARLEAEPVYVVSAAMSVGRSRARVVRSLAAAVAVATFAFIATPSLMDVLQSEPAATPAALAVVAPTPEEPVIATTVAEGVVLRDPRIDDYLIAHQRFSPSVHGSGQYARNATFSGK